MDNLSLYLKNLTGKDEVPAQKAADFLLNSASLELFQLLVDKTEILFDFVLFNVCKRIEKAVNKDNYNNIIRFFDIYSSYYDDLFASILAKHANEELTDKIFELLEKGTLPQKTYSAKYFYYIPDTVALEVLSKYAFSEDENLCYNASQALGQMQDDISYDIALSFLKSEDDFEKLKAVKFFNAYGKNYPLEDIFHAMKTSKMPENIAGQIPYMVSIVDLLNEYNNKEDVLISIDYLLSGLGEILPISDVFQFEMYEILNMLIKLNKSDNVYSGKIAEILLKALSKFKLFTENSEYMYDEDKNTKYEVSSMLNLLKGQNNEFWSNQKHYIIGELKQSEERILAVLPVISEYNIFEAEENIRNLLKTSSNEIILCEAISSLNNLNLAKEEDFNSITNKIHNPNIKAIIEHLKK